MNAELLRLVDKMKCPNCKDPLNLVSESTSADSRETWSCTKCCFTLRMRCKEVMTNVVLVRCSGCSAMVEEPKNPSDFPWCESCDLFQKALSKLEAEPRLNQKTNMMKLAVRSDVKRGPDYVM